jgi:hypothetical protein
MYIRSSRFVGATIWVLVLAGMTPAAAQSDCTDNPWVNGWSPTWHRLFKGIDWAGACTTRLPTNPDVTGQRAARAGPVSTTPPNGCSNSEPTTP